jgi:hypothetical protein
MMVGRQGHRTGMHMWSSFKILIEDLRLSSNMAVTVTKNRKWLSKNILKFGKKPVAEEKNLMFSIVFYFILIFFTNFQVWEAATVMFDGSRVIATIGTINRKLVKKFIKNLF